MSIPTNDSLPLTSCRLSELDIRDEAEEYIRAQLVQGDNIIADNRYFFLPYKHLRLSRPNVESELTESGEGEWRFGIISDRFVKAVQIEVPENEWEVSLNFLDVDPGEQIRFAIRALKPGRELQHKDIAIRWIE